MHKSVEFFSWKSSTRRYVNIIQLSNFWWRHGKKGRTRGEVEPNRSILTGRASYPFFLPKHYSNARCKKAKSPWHAQKLNALSFFSLTNVSFGFFTFSYSQRAVEGELIALKNANFESLVFFLLILNSFLFDQR